LFNQDNAVVVVAERRVRLCAARTALDDLDLEHARSLSLLIIPLPAGKLVVQRVRLTQLFFFVVERGNNNSQERDRTTVCPVFFLFLTFSLGTGQRQRQMQWTWSRTELPNYFCRISNC
jgi:hypothetical protein